MKRVGFQNTVITDGFWKQRQDTVRAVTVHAVYERFKETGRFDAFKCDWKEGDPLRPHVFWDSDVAKWVEGVAYLTRLSHEPELEEIVDGLADLIEKNIGEDGYFNIYFLVVEPEKRFTYRHLHELYCAGHLIEAAVAYYEATGKDKLLRLMQRYADYIEKRFKIDRDTAFVTPGHQEIELALVRLYECTGERRYLELSRFFVDERGKKKEYIDPLYDQSDKPAVELTEATGHSVRAVYYYCGMADIAREYGNEALKDACRRLYRNICEKRMYLTGGIGSAACGEAFTLDYDLPNMLAYTETCAALGLALFAHRMLLIENRACYADTVERVIYNGFLSGVSLSGDSFFYENPLEIIPRLRNRDVAAESKKDRKIIFPIAERKKVFDCSCCPPNVTRFIPSIAEFLYTASDDCSTLYVHQFMQSETELELGENKISVKQTTDYPNSGKVKVSVNIEKPIRLAVRVPEWSEEYSCDVSDDGYIYFDISNSKEISLDFGMPIYFVEANPLIEENCGRVALMKGPVIYCMEGVDNGAVLRDIALDGNAEISEGFDDTIGVPTLSLAAYRRKAFPSEQLYRKCREDADAMEATVARFIPYYAFANRGESEMAVWVRKS